MGDAADFLRRTVADCDECVEILEDRTERYDVLGHIEELLDEYDALAKRAKRWEDRVKRWEDKEASKGHKCWLKSERADRAEAENARLREALEKIADSDPDDYEGRVAREALDR